MLGFLRPSNAAKELFQITPLPHFHKIEQAPNGSHEIDTFLISGMEY